MSCIHTRGGVYSFNGHHLFAYDDAYHEGGADNYSGCRLLCDFNMPRHPSTISRHNERACQRGNELGMIVCDAGGNLTGFDDANHLRLDYSHADLLTAFPPL